MLSDLSCIFDIPVLPEPNTPLPEQDPLAPLNFDDLLDIAREFEFTRTITHIWPREEEPSTCNETGFDDILAAIVTTPNAEENPIPPPRSAPQVQELDLNDSAYLCSMPDTSNIPSHLTSPPKVIDLDQLRPGTTPPITTTLRGWSPPNGSQFLDLDDNLMFAPATDMWNSPWLAMFPGAASTQPLPGDANQSSTANISATGDSQSQATVKVSRPPSVGTSDKTALADEPKKKGVPTPPQPPTRAILEPVRAQSAVQTNSNATSQSGTTPRAKPSKSRLHSTSATSSASTANYGRAPRGGIPPHIARSVTQANILRVEKGRKVMQDSFSDTTMAAAKKPSVLRKVAHVENETNKSANGGGSGKKLLGWDENDEKEARATKRAKV